ncbi:hypothetical protein JOD63_001375 [Microbacterium terrae]|nr:hypothetical protein [Microbacterium terrae]
MTGARAGYATTARTSAAKAIPALAFTAAPTPTITGTAAVGSILTANAGTWSPTPTLAYQWNRNGIAISGATKTTYALVSADQGAMITVTVTASRSGYASTTRTSAVVTVPTGPGAAVVQISADITADTTWAPASSTVYLLTTQVDVRSGVTLTIGANAIVKARTNAGLAVEGALVVNGTAGNPVTFTSLRDDTIGGDSNSDGDVTTPQPGDWYGITISSKASMTATYATVKYASSGWQSSGADVFRLSHGAVSDTQYDGIRVAADRSGANAGNAIISITDTTVRRAGRNGITVSATGQPAGSGTQIPVPVVTDNTVTDSGKGYNNSSVPNQVAIRVHGYALDGSKLTGNDGNGNKISAIALSGTLKTNLSLPQGDLPLALLDSDYLTVAAGATLTIAAGQTVKAYQAGLAVEGSLVVNGTAGNPVTFTSLRDDTIGGDSNSDGDVTTPQPGDWYGITISSKASMTATYATVKYASSGWQSSGADVFRLSHGAVSDTQYDGIRVAADRSGANAGNAIISITDTTVRRAGRNGITVSATGQPAGSGTQIPVPVVTDNTVTDSGKGYNNSSVPNQVAIRVHGYALDGSKLTGNDGNGNKISAIALSGTLKTNLSLPQGDLPLALLDSDYLTVAAGATLTIAAGQTVKAYQAGLAVEGSLVVNGTAGNPVTFTSLRDDTIGGDSNSDGDVTTPQPGDWYGITISSKASMTATYATVKYASSGWQSSGADVFRLSHGAVSDTQYDGIRVAADRSGANAGNAIISITDTTVRRAGRNGITVSATGQPAGSGTQIPVPVVTDNTVTDSGKGYNNSSVPNQVAIRVHGYALDGSKLTGNDGNGNKISAIALSGTLKTNLSLPQGDLPLALLDSDYLTVAAGATLTIAAGQTVKAYQAGLAVEGSLVVNGTAGNPVTFTSLRDDTIGGDSNSDGDVTTPQPGDWYGITISNGGSVHGSGLSVRYASYGITAGQTSSLQLSDSGVSSTTSRCLDVTGADSASYFHGTVRDCEFGVFSSGLTYFDASAVDWGGDEPPGNGADERPRASGPGVDVFPWVGWVDPPPASKPKVYAASPCKDLLVIGVRGSGEEATSANRDMGNMVKTFHDAFVEELAEQSASPISTRTIGLEYPAYAVPLSSPDAPGLLTYTSGAWSGAVELMSTLENEIERCGSSGEKIVLNGYSQGAWVIHSTLAYMEKSKRLPVSNLAAVNLIADPQRAQLGAEYNAGSATGDTWGVANAQVVGVPAVRFSNWLAGSIYPEVRQFQASNVSSEDMITPVDIPTSLLSRVVTICNFTDPVCAIGGRGFPDADVHGEYPTSSGWARFVEESASTARIYAD